VVLGVVAVALASRTVVRNREYSSELSLARTIVARWPTSIAHQILGEQLLAAGDRAEGVKQLQAAVPGDSMARYPLGLELFNQGRLNESVEQLDAFVRTSRLPYRLVPHWLEPVAAEVIQARTTMARALTRLKQWPVVVEQCRLILAMNPSNADAHGLLADALFAEERFNEAAAAYRRYAELRPTDPNPFTQLGLMSISTNKPEEALAAFRHAVEIAPRSWQAQRNLANLLFDTRDVAGAVTHAREAASLKPDDAAAHALLGRALAVLGRLDEAAAEIDRALALDPADPQAREDEKNLAGLRARHDAAAGRPGFGK
jgi:tetratricopeptide (TPR) repeat protein